MRTEKREREKMNLNLHENDNRLSKGIRGEPFETFLKTLLIKASIPKQVIEHQILNDEDVLQIYDQVFTHRSFNDQYNYEIFELYGDVTCNKIVVWWLREKFPFLNCTKGVKVLARLRINLISRDSFSGFAKGLEFSKYISADVETKSKQESNGLLEDIFEAFIGATEWILDDKIRGFSGYYFCYRFLEQILQKEDIQLTYKSLFDPITRLKESFDYFNSSTMKGTCPYIWGNISFAHEKLELGSYCVKLIQQNGGKKEILMQMTGNSISTLKNELSEAYIIFLHENGFKKSELKYYEEIEEMRKKKNECLPRK